MKIKRILKSVLMLSAITILASCGSTKEASNKVDSNGTKEIKLRLAHSQSPQHLINKTAENFVNIIEEKSNGRISVEIYPSETLGTSAEMADAVSTGDVDFYIASTGQFTQRYKPFSIIEAFYMFRDRDHLFKFYESEQFEKLRQGLLEECGVYILSPLYYGSRQMTTSNKPLKGIDDFKGLKLRVANEPLPIEAVKQLGGSPTPVDYGETYLALQQGVVDGQENPPMSILSMKFYEVQKYLNMTNHQYQMMNIFMSDKSMDKLSEEDIQIIKDAAEEASKKHNDEAIDEEEAAIKELSEKLEVVDTNVEEYSEKIKPMYNEFEKDWLDGMVEEIQAIK